MTRATVGWVALALGLAGAALALLLPALLADEETEARRGAAVVATASIEPRSHYVGDRIVATLDISVDPRRADPERIEVEAAFRPYTRVEPVALERDETGGEVRLRLTYVLQCIDRACITRVPQEQPFEFGAALVRFPDPTVGQGTIAVEWPTLLVGSRLEPGALDDPEFRASAEAPPASSWADATVLGWLLAAVAAALALGAGAAIFRWSRRELAEPEPLTPAEAPAASELELALDRVASAGGLEERRAALDALSRALDRSGGNGLAAEARRLAWSRADPSEEELRTLLARIREAGAE